MSDYYTRDGRPAADWREAFPEGKTWDENHRVAETEVNGYWISTVFLGLNHAFGDGPPLIFETMVFRGREGFEDVDSDRYSTEAEALAGHKRLVDVYSQVRAA